MNTMEILANNVFKTITTSKYRLLQNRIIFKLTVNVKYEHDTVSNTKKSTSNSVIRDLLFAPVQCEKHKKHRKVSIIGGGGQIGQIICYNLILKRYCDEIVLYDMPTATSVLGVAMDILGGVSFKDHPILKVCTTSEQTKNSDLLIICAGKGVAKGQTRLDVLQNNVELFRELIPKFTRLSPDCVILVVSNPVDLMTYAAWKFSGFPYQRVLGSGTELDTSRFKYFLSKRIGISPRSINAWIIGEHGLNCVPCWSSINVGGTRLRDIQDSFGLENDPECWIKLEEDVKQNANNIKQLKGFTCYSVAMCTATLAQAILSDSKTVHAVSTCCNGVHDLKVTSFMSLPVVLGSSGVNSIIRQVLDCHEKEKLIKSADILDKALNSIAWDK